MDNVLCLYFYCYPPASKVSREGANLTERKNPNTPVYGVKELVRLSVSDKLLTPIISGLAKQNGLKIDQSDLSPCELSEKGGNKFN